MNSSLPRLEQAELRQRSKKRQAQQTHMLRQHMLATDAYD